MYSIVYKKRNGNYLVSERPFLLNCAFFMVEVHNNNVFCRSVDLEKVKYKIGFEDCHIFETK